jgi:hypothetical protein
LRERSSCQGNDDITAQYEAPTPKQGVMQLPRAASSSESSEKEASYAVCSGTQV